MPGEAAAVLLVEDRSNPNAPRAPGPLAWIGGLALEVEPKDRFATSPHTGELLSRSMARTIGDLTSAGGAADLVVGDLTGEDFRSQVWGDAYVRLRASNAATASEEWCPALHFGAIGAATGPVAACMICRGFARGYGSSGAALVWLLSDAGSRASFWVRRADA